MTAFCLRLWRETDAVSLVRYADDPGIAANLRDVFPSPYTRPDADNFIRDCLEREGRDQLSLSLIHISIHLKRLETIKKRMNRILAENTGRPVEEVTAACERDNFMSADEAKEFGLIDKIILPKKSS